MKIFKYLFYYELRLSEKLFFKNSFCVSNFFKNFKKLKFLPSNFIKNHKELKNLANF